MKTNKSFSKRLKVTKNGKLMARRPGQNHFNAKESANNGRSKGRQVPFNMSNKSRSRFIVSA